MIDSHKVTDGSVTDLDAPVDLDARVVTGELEMNELQIQDNTCSYKYLSCFLQAGYTSHSLRCGETFRGRRSIPATSEARNRLKS